MSAGDWIGLFAVAIFAIFVGIIAVPVFKLGRLFEELRGSIREVTNNTTPTLTELTRTVAHTNQQIEKVDIMTTNAADASANISALTSLFAATLGRPLIKVSAFSYAVRKAFKKQQGTSPEVAAGINRENAEQPRSATAAFGPPQLSAEKAAYMLREANPQFFTTSETDNFSLGRKDTAKSS